MLKRFGFNSVWARLLGLMALIVIPIAIVVFALAYSLYSAALAELSTSQASTAVERARIIRDWFDAAGRSLSSEAAAARFLDGGQCATLAESFLGRNPGITSVQFFDSEGAPCSAGPSLDDKVAALAAIPKDARGHRTVVLVDRICIISSPKQSDGRSQSIVIVDPASLRNELRAKDDLSGTEIALVDSAGSYVLRDGASDNLQWLPHVMPKDLTNWRAADRNGDEAAYAMAPILGSTLWLLMRFDDRRRVEARQQLIILCLAQLAMLGLLAFVYAGAIRRDIVQWIEGINTAAQAQGNDPEILAKAPVGADMPNELRAVAESFNAMADHVVQHQVALKTSLDENRALMLEMHHRIKNSLQVIQSYLALIRRSASRAEATPMLRIEARVGVIAVAYRLALAPSGMRPIAVKPFLEEICGAAVASLRRPRQRGVYAIDWDGWLVVDRAIPLGLGLIEGLIIAFNSPDATDIAVRLEEIEPGLVELKVESDATASETLQPERIIIGLAHQAGATFLAPEGRQVAAWRFEP